MELVAERHHWLNTLVGILDSAFHLTDEEQFFTIDITAKLLDSLDIPDRSRPAELPPAVALEVSSGFYTVRLSSPHDAPILVRPIRAANGTDTIVSVEAWVQALVGMVQVAYPDLDPLERLAASKIFSDLLTAIGVPIRVATFFPEDVVRAYRDIDAAGLLGVSSAV